jgi:transposase InsO family protein
VQDWIAAVVIKAAHFAPGSPWENGYCERYNTRLRNELLNGEIPYSLETSKIIIENNVRITIRKRSNYRWVIGFQLRQASCRVTLSGYYKWIRRAQAAWQTAI